MEVFSMLVRFIFVMQYMGYSSMHVLDYPNPTDGSGDDEDMDMIRTRAQYIAHLNSIHSNIGSLSLLQKLNPGLSLYTRNPQENTTFTIWDLIKKSCNTERDCGSKNTCNIYTGICERCRFENELCRRNANCCDGLKCVWGRCRRVVRDGKDFSLCNTNADCQPNLCCAREHGQNVCKPYLSPGDKCEIPLGGLKFSVTHKCPCQAGLTCKRNSSHGRKRATCAAT